MQYVASLSLYYRQNLGRICVEIGTTFWLDIWFVLPFSVYKLKINTIECQGQQLVDGETDVCSRSLDNFDLLGFTVYGQVICIVCVGGHYCS